MKIIITILGLLMEGNLYGYEIKKKIVERLEGFLDIKFGSIYYAIKKAVSNDWVKSIGTEKVGGNPERYIYQIMKDGKKYYKKILKQYFENNLIHFEIDIVLMFLNSLEPDQLDRFIEDRMEFVKENLIIIKDKIKIESSVPDEKSQINLYRYIDVHLKAEFTWLKSLKKDL